MTATPADLCAPQPDPGAALSAEVFAAKQHQRLDRDALAGGDSVWFGLGICGTTLSAALPIDVLLLLCGQELLRRALGLRRSIVLVADSNAIAVGHPRAQVQAVAERVEGSIARLRSALDLPVDCVRASAVASWSEHARHEALVRGLPAYEAHQLVQTEALRRAGATVKLGWIMPGGARDERYFDRLHRERGGGRVAFAYTVCGRGLAVGRPRACPYVVERPDERILVAPGESIANKLHRARHRAPRETAGYRRLLRRITRTIARMRGAPIRRAPERELQSLLDRCHD
jgi:hypothetical protein